jgi:DNA-directed RNA polymerase specialized sigma24 family protein
MSTSRNTNRSQRHPAGEKLIAGLTKHRRTATPVVVEGVEIRMRDVENLYFRFVTRARDLATQLIGDPFQAERVARQVFRDLLGSPSECVRPGRRLDAWIDREVVRLCLMQSGNEEVADWEGYQSRHPDKEPRSRRTTAKAPRTASVQPATGFPAQASQPATRKARAQIEARRAPSEATHDEARGQTIAPMAPRHSAT